MTPAEYPGTYRDAKGIEPVTIYNDGRTLRVTIRGVEFEGGDFDLLDPVDGAEAAQRAGFVLSQDSLCACELRCDMPLPVVAAGVEETARLGVHLVLGAPSPRGGLDREDLRLQLTWSGGTIGLSGSSGWFEDDLLALQRQLPDGASLRACITCGLSDYWPAGHGLFGSMMCFRQKKEAYRAVATKGDLFAISGDGVVSVQETDLCAEYEGRRAGTGYRG